LAIGQLEKFNVTHPSVSLIPRQANTKVHQDIGDEHKRKFIFFANSFATGMQWAVHARFNPEEDACLR
jgi:hypothetical protein